MSKEVFGIYGTHVDLRGFGIKLHTLETEKLSI
jgi:hypothetical protein